eukprot:14731534-Alexandrium_andersonii.AAC.1
MLSRNKVRSVAAASWAPINSPSAVRSSAPVAERPASLAADPRHGALLWIRPRRNRSVRPHGECNAARRDFFGCNSLGGDAGGRPLDLVEFGLAAAVAARLNQPRPFSRRK